jgi:transposase
MELFATNARERGLRKALRCVRALEYDQSSAHRSGSNASDASVDSIETTLDFLNEQVDEIDEQIRELIDEDPMLRGRRDLLESIPGVGERVAVTILGELPNIHEFRSGKAVAAFAGLCPREFRSGTSVSAS